MRRMDGTIGRGVGRTLARACIAVAMAAWCSLGLSPAMGQSSESDYRPPSDPAAAQSQLDAARGAYQAAEAAYERSVRSVYDAEQKAIDMQRRLREANAAMDAYLAQLEAQGPSPARREAIKAVEDARVELEQTRARAIRPLRDDPVYRAWQKDLAECRAKFAELDRKRQRADFIGFGMEEQDRRDLVRYAQRMAELDAKVYGRELGVLDEHAAYKAATVKLTETKKVARETVAWLRELDESDPTRKAMIERVTAANAEADSADRSLDDARRARKASGDRVAAAKAELAEAERRKGYADRGLTAPRRGE